MDDPTMLDAYPFELENFDPAVDEISSEVVQPARHAADRSIARRASLQILYELDTTDHALADALAAHFSERPEAYAVRQIIRHLVGGVMQRRVEIDAILQEYAPDWPIDQVAVVDRNILRLGVFEFLMQKRSTPVPVIVNEAVHLAQLFGAEHSHSFVHGVLGAITNELAPEVELAADEGEAL